MPGARRQPDCLSDETVVRLSSGELSGPALTRAETHLDGCEDCRLLVGATEAHRTTAPRAEADEQPPRIADGRYHPLNILGRGGMGVVYRATDTKLKREVALKVVPGSTGLGATPRLRREAEALAKLSHKNIVSVYDVGTVGQAVFIAMELVEGQTLRDWLAADPRPGRILDVFGAAGQGLAAAHDAGVIHRDFKPENVVVAQDEVKVVDFGLARIGTAEVDTATQPPVNRACPDSAFMGTPRYMAPEQFANQPTDARTDQFSFCVALCEALYRQLPHPLVGAPDKNERLPRRAGVSRATRIALEKGLSHNPEHRHANMRVLLDSLGSRRARVTALGTAAAVVATVAAGVIWAQLPADAGHARDVGAVASTEATPARLRALHDFLAAHVQGRHFHQPRESFVIEPNNIEGEDVEDEWVSELRLQGNHLSWQRRRDVDHTNYALDSEGRRVQPGHRVARTGVDRYVFSLRAGTDSVMGLSYPVSGSGWENSLSMRFDRGDLILTGKSATEFRTVKRGGTYRPVVFTFEERYHPDADGGTTKTVTVWGFYYDKKRRARNDEPYMTVVSVLRAPSP